MFDTHQVSRYRSLRKLTDVFMREKT